MVEVLYFAWVRERIGLPREKVQTDAVTVAGLIAELMAREERYALAMTGLTGVAGAAASIFWSSATFAANGTASSGLASVYR